MARSRQEGSETTIEPRRRPRQDRSREMVERILEAGRSLLQEVGFKGLTTIAIAERAGLSVGSLYQYFPNKDALVSALHGRHMRQMMAVIDKALTRPEHTGLENALTGLIEAAVEAHLVEADLHRVLEQQLAGLDVAKDGHGFDDTVQCRIHGLLQRYRDEITLKDLKLGTFVLMHAVHALIHASVLELPAGVSTQAAIREIVRMVFNYLTASTGPRVPA